MTEFTCGTCWNASRPSHSTMRQADRRFSTNGLRQKATLRELQELAESSQRLSTELRARRPEIPWQAIAGFRNVLVHDYPGLSLPRVWSVIENDLPALREAVESLLHELEAGW